MASNTYSFKDIVAAIVGPGGVINLADGAGVAEEGIDVQWLGETDNMIVGADGEGMHSLRADRSAKATVRLLKTSPTNALLSLMYNFQRSSGAQHGQNTITIVDKLRGDVITLRQAAFSKAPSLSFASVAGTVEWEFNVIKGDLSLGGR